MYFLQVITIMILSFFKYVYRFGTVLIQEIHEKLNIRQFHYANKTDFYFQSVYLGLICDSPVRIKITRQFVTYVKDVCFEYLTIQWNNINLGLHDLDFKNFHQTTQCL